MVEVSITRSIIDQLTPSEMAELNRWLPAMVDGIRRNQDAARRAFENFTGGTIQ